MSNETVLSEIWDTIEARLSNPTEESYTCRIINHKKGIDKILEKVGEEAVEFVIAVKNRKKEEIILEAADLQFHLMLALKAAGVSFDDVLDELIKRRK
ncbi:MAG: phosphoribosyl-ATP diphosphatase [Methanospirillaceae archaeon]|nr:phosphoribosyl-ATP diphosphatase [Methanospirillaceae archaeon]